MTTFLLTPSFFHVLQSMRLLLLREKVCCQRNRTCRSTECLSFVDLLSAILIGTIEHGSELHQLSNQGCLSILQIDSHHDGGICVEQANFLVGRIRLCPGSLRWFGCLCSCRLEFNPQLPSDWSRVGGLECLCRCHPTQCSRTSLFVRILTIGGYLLHQLFHANMHDDNHLSER